MSRPKRKIIKFDENSVNDLLQEIYNDSHNIKAKISRLFTKWESKAKSGEDIVVLGESIIKLINAEAKNQDQKIVLLRYLKEVVFAKGKAGDSTEEQGTVPLDGKMELVRQVKLAMAEDNKTK